MIFERFHKDEKGSALTEFTIGLPIFLIIFSGLISIYQLSEASLISQLTANQKLWENTQDISAAKDLLYSSPITVAAESGADLLDIASGKGSIKDLLNASQAGGIYTDSWAKNKAADLIPGATVPDPIHKTVSDIHESFTETSPAQSLLNDNVVENAKNAEIPDTIAGALSSILSISGANLGIATGIRYGTDIGESKKRTISTPFGEYTIGSRELSLSRNTSPTHRLASVGIIRLKHAETSVLDSILQLEKTSDTSGPPKWTDEDPEEKEVEECKPMTQKDFDKCVDAVYEGFENNWEADCKTDIQDDFEFESKEEEERFIENICDKENIPNTQWLASDNKKNYREDAQDSCRESARERQEECSEQNRKIQQQN